MVKLDITLQELLLVCLHPNISFGLLPAQLLQQGLVDLLLLSSLLQEHHLVFLLQEYLMDSLIREHLPGSLLPNQTKALRQRYFQDFARNLTPLESFQKQIWVTARMSLVRMKILMKL